MLRIFCNIAELSLTEIPKCLYNNCPYFAVSTVTSLNLSIVLYNSEAFYPPNYAPKVLYIEAKSAIYPVKAPADCWALRYDCVNA